jgi:SAM-dependent methyltransferase
MLPRRGGQGSGRRDPIMAQRHRHVAAVSSTPYDAPGRSLGTGLGTDPVTSPSPHRELWRSAARVARYARTHGWIDDGERLVLHSVADEVRGRPVLDLGVGAGRTAWLLRLLTADYLAVDWSPEMVAACRAALPGVDVREGDARDLEGVPESRFALAFFSYNGIDNLDHAGRTDVLDSVRRVLRPGGLFVYSTASKLGPAFRERPTFFAPRHPGEPAGRFVARALYLAATTDHRARAEAWRLGMRAAEDHGDWGMAPMAALDFRVAHFTTVAAEASWLARHGLAAERFVASSGEEIAADRPGDPWFYVVARKPAR